MQYDFAVIGAGIVGLSTAWQLKQRRPSAKVLLLEKEVGPGAHQTGRNSGVVHAGVYYAPGSLKAEFCKAGLRATMKFCSEADIPFVRCGKLLVATDEIECQRMEALFDRANENGISVVQVGAEQLKRLEPNVAGRGAIHVRDTSIVDYALVARNMARRFLQAGGQILYGAQVTALDESDREIRVRIDTQGSVTTRFMVSCAGLQADRIARMLGIAMTFRIIPFRGEYYALSSRFSNIVSRLIYPIPDPELPFLGIHLTRTMNGRVTVGPNAVLGFKREGYGKVNVDLPDSVDMLRFKGFWRLIRRQGGNGIRELRNSLWKRGYLRQVQKYCPSIGLYDLRPHPVGIRAQAVKDDGSLVQDFLFAESDRSLHVCNAPSPAATSAIPIGAYIVDRVCERS